MITDSNNLIPVNTSISSLSDAQKAITALSENLTKLNSYGLGFAIPFFDVKNINANYQIVNNQDTASNQFFNVISAASPGALTLNFPSSPTIGSMYYFYDYTGNCNTYNITIARNGNTIDGSTSNVTLSTNYTKALFICVDTNKLHRIL